MSLTSLLQRTSMNIIIVAAASIPVAFVVVSATATDGEMAQTRTHLELYIYNNINNIIIYFVTI